MKRLYQAADRIEAQLLKDYLAAHGIAAVVLGDYLSGAAGELAAIQFPSVWVIEERDFPIACKWLDAFLKPGLSRPSLPSWVCPACGETVEAGFDLCWNCGTSRE